MGSFGLEAMFGNGSMVTEVELRASMLVSSTSSVKVVLT